jgi:hypothetical protein
MQLTHTGLRPGCNLLTWLQARHSRLKCPLCRGRLRRRRLHCRRPHQAHPPVRLHNPRPRPRPIKRAWYCLSAPRMRPAPAWRLAAQAPVARAAAVRQLASQPRFVPAHHLLPPPPPPHTHTVPAKHMFTGCLQCLRASLRPAVGRPSPAQQARTALPRGQPPRRWPAPRVRWA